MLDSFERTTAQERGTMRRTISSRTSLSCRWLCAIVSTFDPSGPLFTWGVARGADFAAPAYRS